MSDNERGESRTVGAFLLGFLTGVLVCVGIGGALTLFQIRHGAVLAREAAAEAMRAEEEARRRAAEAMAARAALEAARKAREAREAGETGDPLPMPRLADE